MVSRITTKENPELNDFFTAEKEAIKELKRRREDKALLRKVYDFLNGDIPEHFSREKPIVYLARHIATPNYETLRFVELAKQHKLPIVIGMDKRDKFVSNSILKKPLGKMPILKGTARNGDEIIENFTIINFDSAQGKPLESIYTNSGEKLVDFHTRLLKQVYDKDVELIDESEWIDRNERGNLLEHYKRTLALLIAHGVMYEFYEDKEYSFVEKILKPAFEFCENYFGERPLICNLVDENIANQRDWNSYPSVIYPFVRPVSSNTDLSKTKVRGVHIGIKKLKVDDIMT